MKNPPVGLALISVFLVWGSKTTHAGLKLPRDASPYLHYYGEDGGVTVLKDFIVLSPEISASLVEREVALIKKTNNKLNGLNPKAASDKNSPANKSHPGMIRG